MRCAIIKDIKRPVGVVMNEKSSLSKKVIDILGGEIAVQSEVNKGSTFTILLKDIVYEN